jgi:hypothetical protein
LAVAALQTQQVTLLGLAQLREIFQRHHTAIPNQHHAL